MPLISVLMGVYNCRNREGLRRSIDSIRNQTLTDWEFLICDDGSTDDTLAFLQEITRDEPRIRILAAGKNGGLARALNLCLAQARGAYIARQDDDDISLPSRFAEEMAFLDSHPQYSYVGTCMDVFDDSGVWGHLDAVEIPDKKTFFWTSAYHHPTVIFRREAMEAVKGYREEDFAKRVEDYDLFMRMHARGYVGYNLQRRLYQYRVIVGKEKYRPMQDRVREARVRFSGYRELKLYPLGLIFVMKPLLIGLIPQRIFAGIRRKIHQRT